LHDCRSPGSGIGRLHLRHPANRIDRTREHREGGSADPETASWYVNDDRSIWMLNQNWVPGKRTKTAWFRPARARLEVTGRRLDAQAPPLVFDTPPADSYRHRFTPSDMTFPTSGYWEITAKAGGSAARFVVKVLDGPARAGVD
jgi:hypothetical protein